jgi:hypothetical protein
VIFSQGSGRAIQNRGGVVDGLIAVALIIVYLFAFEWVFITTGLYAGNAQAAQGISLILGSAGYSDVIWPRNGLIWCLDQMPSPRSAYADP